MPKTGLIVRRAVRHEVVLPAKVRVAPEHTQTVRFAKGVTDEGGWITCDLIDFAIGGAGVISGVFFPRGAALELLIPADDPNEPPTLRLSCRVMRVQMTDRRPAYLIGLAFSESSDETNAAVEQFLDRLEGGSDETGPAC
ncbi:MAG: PilZ domain-containing protein [Planctomycetota bacterium]